MALLPFNFQSAYLKTAEEEKPIPDDPAAAD